MVVIVDAVNAWADDERVIVALRSEGTAWDAYSLDHQTAIQLADQLRLLTGTPA